MHLPHIRHQAEEKRKEVPSPDFRCTKLVTVRLACQHEVTVACWQTTDPQSIRCKDLCGKPVRCGHSCKQPCAARHDHACAEPCTVDLVCGHKCQVSPSSSSISTITCCRKPADDLSKRASA